jgi:hypothetical protein
VFPTFVQRGERWVRSGGEYGTEAFKKNIRPVMDGRGYRYANERLAEEIRDNLSEYSSIFAAILHHIVSRPKELVFIYNEYVEAGGGGSINLALVLQQHGFVWAKSAEDIRKPDSKGRKRFAVITSNKATTHQPKQIESLIRSFNQPDNMYGERCQIIIGSKKIAEGITIKNVRQGHSVIPHWNVSDNDQAFGRIFRVGSHDALPQEERYVRIYRHASVKEYNPEEDSEAYNRGKGFPESAAFSDEVTMDIHAFEIAERKDYFISQIYRLMKEVAWDCSLTYERNVLKGDQDYSRACDYQECNYTCDGFPESKILKKGKVWRYQIPEEEILTSTYNLFYSSSDIRALIGEISNLFEVYFCLELSMIERLLGRESSDRYILLQALETLISSRIPIQNRYGFVSYLKEENNIYFLGDTVSAYSDYAESTYTQAPLTTEKTSLQDLVEISQLRDDKTWISRFCQSPSKYAKALKKMHYRTLIVLLEKIKELHLTTKSLTSQQKTAVDIVLSNLGRNLFSMTGGIFFHNMYASEYTGLGYNVTVQEIKPTGLMRVFDPKMKTWRYVSSVEEEERYIARMKEMRENSDKLVWENNPYGVYGFRAKDGKFKIRVQPAEGQRNTKGSVCIEGSWSVIRILNLFRKMGEYPSAEGNFEQYSRKELLQKIRSSGKLDMFLDVIDGSSTDDLRRILNLGMMEKVKLCDSLEGWFRAKGLFVEEEE